MSDLSLESLDNLKDAIYARCNQCVIITKRSEDAGKDIVRSFSKTGTCDGVGLATIAQSYFLSRMFDEK